MVNVLFVCTGNICRSPVAEGVFRFMVADAGLADVIDTDSAGIGSWHVGDPPDTRARASAAKRGYDIEAQRARQVAPGDYDAFDLLLGMDTGHFRDLRSGAPKYQRHKVARFLDAVPHVPLDDVPDPYYGGGDGFEQVLDLVEAGCEAWLARIRQEHL